MALFTQKVHRRLGGDYTFLVLTDRTDLDNKIYKTFTSVGLANTDKDPCRAGSAQELRDLLGQQKKVIFGMIQKFTDDQAKGGVYATRDNIIVMTLWSATEGLNFDLTKHLRPYVMRNLTMSAFHLLHEQRLSFRDGQIVMTETPEEELEAKLELMRSDLDYLQKKCVRLPSVAKVDPPDEVIRFRREAGGRFFDDIFAADGSDRVLISEDFHLRSWAEGLLGVRGAWVQALLFHLEDHNRISVEDVVKGTIQLQHLGEDALSTNADSLLAAAEMMGAGEISEDEFARYSALLGQKGSEMRSHVQVAEATIRELWSIKSLVDVRERATGIILRNLTRLQGADSRVVLETVQTLNRNAYADQYIKNWRIGHFLT